MHQRAATTGIRTLVQRASGVLTLAAALGLFGSLFTARPAFAADTTPPTATVSTPATLTDPVTVTFSEGVKNVTTDNVGVRLDGASSNLPASLVCRDSGGAGVSCVSGPAITVVISPGAFTPGQLYFGWVNPGGPAPVTDIAGNAAIPVSHGFRGSTVEQETSVAGRYYWRAVSDASAYGGSYTTERKAGAYATYRFTGSALNWYTILGPDQGKATVTIDGHSKGTFDQYRSSKRYHAARIFTGLGSGSHTFVLRLLGTKRSAATGTNVVLDAFTVDAVLDATPAAGYRWRFVHTSAASGGQYTTSNLAGDNVYFTFAGPGIDWYTISGPDQGIAKMYVDGGLKLTVDNYATKTTYNVVRSLRNMSDSVHSLRIVVQGKKRSSSHGTNVAVDRFAVKLVSIAAFRGLGAWVDLFDYSLDPHTTVAAMHAHGVKTVFIETARYSSSADIDHPTDIDKWLAEAHAIGMKVVGWYFPAYSEYMDTDVRRTVAIAKYRSPTGQKFDALGIDIEYKGKTSSLSEFNSNIVTHLDRVKSGAGSSFAIAAIVPAPLGMAVAPSSWTGFPWAAIGQRAHVVMPMAYWSYRTDCSTNPDHCPYGYAVGNVNQSHALTGLPVHIIGGVGDNVSTSEVSQFVNGTLTTNAYGGSLYDYRTTASSFWTYLEKLNAL